MRSTGKSFVALCTGLVMAALTVASAVALAPEAHAALGLGLSEKPDKTWMTNGVVYAQALSGDGKTLYIGGKFTQVRETPPGTPGKTFNANRVAAIDVATGAPKTNWNPGVSSNDGTVAEVRALAVQGGKVYVGGKFTTVGGQARRNLAAVDAVSGAVDTSFAPRVGDSTSTVFTILSGASRLYVGGKFTNVNGTGRGNLAAFDLPSGALSTAWKPRANAIVRKLTFDAGRITVFAAGNFTSVTGSDGGSAARQSVARFDTATGNVHPWAIPSGAVEAKQIGWDMIATPTRLYVGMGEVPNHADAFRLDNGNSGNLVWRYGLVGNAVSLAFSPNAAPEAPESRLIVGGHFGINPLDQRVCFNRQLKGLVALEPRTGRIDCTWIPSLDVKSRPNYDGAWDLTTVGNQLWVSGGFVGVSGEPQSNLARFTYDPTLP